MAYEAVRFAHDIQECDWLFDFFACGFDHLSVHLDTPRTDAQLDELLRHQRHLTDLTAVVQAADGAIPPGLWEYLDVPGNYELLRARPFLLRLAATLRTIDDAAGPMNYYSGYRDAELWPRVTREMHRQGMRLNKGGRTVVLKPQPRFPLGSNMWWERAITRGVLAEEERRGEHWSTMFSNLCRVPDVPNCELDLRVLPRRLDLDHVDWSTLRIGMVPLIRTLEVGADAARLRPGPLQLVTDADNHFIVAAEHDDYSELCEQAEKALRVLAERQVHIVLFPEAVVPDDVVKHIKSVLRDLSRSGTRYPVLVLAGTFGRRNGAGGAHNEAIVLNGRGDELWRQSKVHPYGMQRHEQERYGLDGIFNRQTATEHITTHPRRLVFCDSKSTQSRIVVAICEDSAHDDPCLSAIRGLCPNLVLIPVMAGALLPDRGFVKTASDLARNPRCLAAVVNSAALPRAEWQREENEGKPPLGVVGLPGLLRTDAKYAPFWLLQEVEQVNDTEVLVFECPPAG